MAKGPRGVENVSGSGSMPHGKGDSDVLWIVFDGLRDAGLCRGWEAR